MLDRIGGLLPQRRPKIFFPAQNRAWRSDGNPEVARNHFRLGPFSGTRCAKKNKPPFHSRSLSPIKENGDPGNHEHGDPYIEPHQRAAGRRFAATIGGAIK